MSGEINHDDVQKYYGKDLTCSDDLKTSACTTPAGAMSKAVKKALSKIHDEVVMKYYGCGICIPPALEKTRVLDLGCGAGRDVYAIAQLVGEEGHVIGVDMTPEQLETARKYEDFHKNAFGFANSNVTFKNGLIEKLGDVGIEDNSIDVIVSNCVINLVPDKESVIREVARVLKEGGELYFSDVYSDKEISEAARKDYVLWGECISGALLWTDLYDLCEEFGLSAPLLVDCHPFVVEKELAAKLGSTRFVSATYRIFKPSSKPSKEKVKVTYNGEIPEVDTFQLAQNYQLKKNEPRALPVEMSADLKGSRYAKFFTFEKSGCVPFQGQPLNPFNKNIQNENSGSCC
ncbi:unnamed protein product [Oikopleura dioica]|uniref:Arsenite methyltransferase n=1 Tax=Oikopleura dioica TaxID=34765 RepID=E4WT15_OIKDI|nr:unnamed protein product [Oikopleura dioica]